MGPLWTWEPHQARVGTSLVPILCKTTSFLGRGTARDFSSFRAQSCQAKSPVRQIPYCDLEREGERLELRIGANGFLHHRVRNIVGVLVAIGQGEAEVGWVEELLAIRDRTRGGVTAPPQGLYFVRADYPAGFALPRRG